MQHLWCGGRGAAARSLRGHQRTQGGAAAGTRHPVWTRFNQPCLALSSRTEALMHQPGAPHSPKWSTQGGSWHIRTGAARGQGGRVVAWTPRQQRRQRPTMLTSALSCRLKYNIVIKMVSFLLAARQFSPPGAANSQFWLRSGMHKLSPHATTLPKPEGRCIIFAHFILQGSILQLF
jgi:hypothetical protein